MRLCRWPPTGNTELWDGSPVSEQERGGESPHCFVLHWGISKTRAYHFLKFMTKSGPVHFSVTATSPLSTNSQTTQQMQQGWSAERSQKVRNKPSLCRNNSGLSVSKEEAGERPAKLVPLLSGTARQMPHAQKELHARQLCFWPGMLV